jgi:hypothetical protein
MKTRRDAANTEAFEAAPIPGSRHGSTATHGRDRSARADPFAGPQADDGGEHDHRPVHGTELPPLSLEFSLLARA